MSFGQQSGPPASQKQVAYLKSLFQKAGFDDFRAARHSYGLTQRQAGGKFTTREASALIDQLLGVEPADEGIDGADGVAPKLPISGERVRAETVHADARVELLRGMPAELLSAELERRGWQVTPPD